MRSILYVLSVAVCFIYKKLAFFFTIMSLVADFLHTLFFLCRSCFDVWHGNRFRHLYRSLAHALSFKRCLRSHFRRSKYLNLLYISVKGIYVLLSNREMVQFKLQFDDGARQYVSDIMYSDRFPVREYPQRDGPMCCFDIVQTGLVFPLDRPMFGELIALAIYKRSVRFDPNNVMIDSYLFLFGSLVRKSLA